MGAWGAWCRWWAGAVGAAVAVLLLSMGSAIALDSPRGPVVLTITAEAPGTIGNANPAGVAQFDDAMLDALPESRISTTTPWTDGVHSYAGPRLSDVLALVEARGTMLVITALNDYVAHVPFADAQAYGPILARRMDGKPMRVRDRGPLFLVYPFDANDALRTDTFFSRSVWQIRSITVR